MNSFEKFNLFREELKTKNDIVSIISKYVPLERKGRTFWGRCPFHNEKTPSFAVNSDGQFYHCFGCGAGGDVVRFVQEIESIDYMGAIHMLAELAHMEVPSFSNYVEDNSIKQRKEEKDRLLKLMKEAAMFYVNNLKSMSAYHAREYLQKRQISPEVARAFGIGYSSNYYDVIKHLKSKGYTFEEIEKAGVGKRKDGDKEPYDAMGNRVVFPIIDISSNVIAFSGRSLEAKPNFAKYLNTAETVLFNKSKSLFGINMVKKAKMNSGAVDSLIIVEGHMDVVSLHKAGFNTAVASMGTALTNEQAKLIKRFADKVYICYDGDTAGKKATLRGLDILRECGLDVYVMSMPEGMDPDDVINKYGAAGYSKLMEKALPLIDFKLEFLKSLYDLTTSEGKTKFLNEALSVLRSLDDVEREVYVQKVSDLSGIMKDFIKRQLDTKSADLSGDTKALLSTKTDIVEKRQKSPIDSRVVQAEKFILSAYLHQKPYVNFKNDMNEYFTEERQNFYKAIRDILNEKQGQHAVQAFYNKYANECVQPDGLESAENDELSEQASEIINYMLKNSSEEFDLNYYKDCLFIIYKNYAENQIDTLTKSLDSVIEKEKRNEILNKIKQLSFNIKNKKVDL